MRQIININKDWAFSKLDGNNQVEQINVPHTWNAIDGTDGGNDYWRGQSSYRKLLDVPALDENEELYLEVNGANSTSKVVLNGKELAEHKGGYSTYRVNLTEELKNGNSLEILVDNTPNNEVYPQQADFTFYGGLYRNVNLIKVNKAHFALNYYGGTGIALTPVVLEDGKGELQVAAYTQNAQNGDTVTVCIKDAKGNTVACQTGTIQNNQVSFNIPIENIHLWDGVEDPYLYTADATLSRGEDKLMNSRSALDSVHSRSIQKKALS